MPTKTTASACQQSAVSHQNSSATAQRSTARKAGSDASDITQISIIDEPYPQPVRASVESKYAAVFSRLQPGQRLACASADTARIASALRKWVQVHRADPKPIIRIVRECADGRGGVWWLAQTAAPAPAKPARAKTATVGNPWAALAPKRGQ